MIYTDKFQKFYISERATLETYENLLFIRQKLEAFIMEHPEFEDLLDVSMKGLQQSIQVLDSVINNLDYVWKKLIEHITKEKEEKRKVMSKGKGKASKGCCSTKGKGTKTKPTKQKGKSSCKK